MSLYGNSTPPQAVYANRKSMDKVYANGTLVWQKEMPTVNCRIYYIDDNSTAHCFFQTDIYSNWNINDFYSNGYTKFCVTNWGDADNYYEGGGYDVYYNDYPYSFWDYGRSNIYINDEWRLTLNPSQNRGSKLYFSLAANSYGYAYVTNIYAG